MRMTADDRTNTRSGQAMLIAVLSLGGAILGATTVAGLLTLYQIRASTNSAESAKAIFAADAGVGWVQFDHYCTTDPSTAGDGRCPQVTPGVNDYPMPTFGDPTLSITVFCYPTTDTSGNTSLCSDPNTVAGIATGLANGSERAFYVGISDSPTTYP